MGIEKGAGDILNEDIGTLTREQAENVADRKMDDLNAHDMDAAVKIIFGTARSMGIETDE
jgi:large subunit ribosomal protein L11